jgi:hypothetical protein
MECGFCKNFGSVIVHYPSITKVKLCPKCKGESSGYFLAHQPTPQQLVETMPEKSALEYEREYISKL